MPRMNSIKLLLIAIGIFWCSDPLLAGGHPQNDRERKVNAPVLPLPAGVTELKECQESTNNSVCTVASAETDFIAIAAQGRVTVRRLSDQRVLWRSYHCSVSALAFSTDGNTLASAGRDRAGLTTI